MPRSTYIYLVLPKDSPELVLAVFTVKKEAKQWAEQSSHSIDELVLTRMIDGGDGDIIGTRVKVHWDT